MRAHLTSLFVVLLTMVATPSTAHELWLQPSSFQIPVGGEILADIRVGQNFKGGSSGYFARNFTRFQVSAGQNLMDIEGRTGDFPAATVVAQNSGLHVLIYETTKSTLNYKEWEKFENFVLHKDFKTALADHAARGLPETGFVEIYSRHVKSLIGVGAAQGADRAFGLETEIIAGANPYTDDLSAGFPVTVLYRDAPRKDAQVEVFEMAPDGEVTVFTTRTDALGRATVPVKAGYIYNLDAVVLRAVDGPDGAVWDSLWAGLTFAVPE